VRVSSSGDSFRERKSFANPTMVVCMLSGILRIISWKPRQAGWPEPII
jgi:hypothetical protein